MKSPNTKTHKAVYKEYDIFCELCNEYHSYLVCPNCSYSAMLGFYSGIVNCDGCGKSFYLVKGKTLIECEYLDAKIGCLHPHRLQNALDWWECENCPVRYRNSRKENNA